MRRQIASQVLDFLVHPNTDDIYDEIHVGYPSNSQYHFERISCNGVFFADIDHLAFIDFTYSIDYVIQKNKALMLRNMV